MKKRIEWIDSLKGLGMYLVVWGHCFSSNNFSIKKYIYSFHMPLFFLLSGITSVYSTQTDFKTFLKKKIKSLLLPYIMINLIGIFILYILSLFDLVIFLSVPEYLIGLIYSNTRIVPHASNHTWFLTCMFLVEIAFYFIRKHIKDDKQIFVLSLFCVLVSYLNSITSYRSTAPWHLQTVFMGLFFYIMGYFYSKYIINRNELEKKKLFVTGLCLGIIGLILSTFNPFTSMYSNLYGNPIIYVVSALMTILGLICFVKIFLSKSYLFKKIGTYTVFYLGYQHYIITFYKKTFPCLTSSNICVLIFSIMTTILLFALSFICYKYFPFVIGKFKKKGVI